ncbi:MAG: FAD-dependent oxidoreductase [Deltaproteobacteria bacterium]|jgi:heterodisulfide reductase subunit A|nr:FAD-dependent oxidoreductase [Deltaproteobacteria bacterium]
MASNNVVGAVLVAGGGVAGMQASLDLANAGYYVYLVEKSLAIGGRMSQLDKTFPTNDCSMCIISPKLVEVGRHVNVSLLTLTDILSIEGEEGDFTVKARKNPRYIDMSKCIACGECTKKCPKKLDNEYNEGLDQRRAVYVQYAQAVPLKYGIDAENCLKITKGKCGTCKKLCPADAIDYDDKPEDIEFKVGSVVLSPGFAPFKPSDFATYRYADSKDVITALEFERYLGATGPTMGHVIRPSDRADPKKMAFLQCVGSRDINRADNGYCSSVCCMYAIKEALIAKEHAWGALDVTVFYMDIRTFGKDFERYYEKAKAAGIKFVRSRVHTVQPEPKNGVMIHYVTDGGVSTQEFFDLAVLSHGLVITGETKELAEGLGIERDCYDFAKTGTFSPVALSRPGFYACGVFTGPKDIPTSVMEASAAAAAATSKLTPARSTLTKVVSFPAPVDVTGEPPRIGVFICHCGINIASVVDVPKVVEFAKTLPFVEYASNTMFACSQDAQEKLVSLIKEYRLNRIVVSACSPRTHEPLFQETLVAAGLNKYLYEMANIRNHDSWVHAGHPAEATRKAMDMTEMAVAKAALLVPLKENVIDVDPTALVIGGGVAGMNAAMTLSSQGFKSVIVEKADKPGGNANRIHTTAKGESVPQYLAELSKKIADDPNITLVLNSEVDKVDGYVGNFVTKLTTGEEIKHGVTIVATGAKEHRPTEYLYGKHPSVVTQLELDEKLKAGDPSVAAAGSFVFVQCVGSREPDRLYCSKVCCAHTVHAAIEIKKLNPAAKIFVLYRDIRTYAQKEDLYKEARSLGVIFVRHELENKPEVLADDEGVLRVKVFDPVSGHVLLLAPDYLVLAAAMVSGREEGLAMKYKVPLDQDGWFFEAHQKLRPVDFATDGMFMAGICHYPKPMDEVIAQAQAAAARAVTILTQPRMTVGGIVAEINQNKCSGCGLCVQVCPYKAVDLDDKGKAVVNEALCKGCGNCSSSCRSDAPSLRGFTNAGLFAQIASAL